MRSINKIIVHCTNTPLETSVESIKKYHLSLGYKDIGYHFLIDRFGFIHNGRPVEEIGAHCYGQNENSIGIALIGGFKGKFDFTMYQINTLQSLVRRLSWRYNLSLRNIHGHNEFSKSKSCPNFNVQNFFAYEGK